MSILGAVRITAQTLAEQGREHDRLEIVETLSSEIDEDITEPMIKAVEFLIAGAECRVRLPYLPRAMQHWEQ